MDDFSGSTTGPGMATFYRHSRASPLHRRGSAGIEPGLSAALVSVPRVRRIRGGAHRQPPSFSGGYGKGGSAWPVGRLAPPSRQPMPKEMTKTLSRGLPHAFTRRPRTVQGPTHQGSDTSKQRFLRWPKSPTSKGRWAPRRRGRSAGRAGDAGARRWRRGRTDLASAPMMRHATSCSACLRTHVLRHLTLR